MIETLEPASTIVRKCGGHLTVADWAGVTLTTVYRWTYPVEHGGTGGLVPSRHQIPLLVRARSEGVDLRPDDFFTAVAA
jgi:hypothetical protein